MPLPWIYLLIAGLLEIGWTMGLKYSAGFTRPLASALTILAMILSMGLLGLAVRDLPIGTAYAVWTGIGTVGAVVLGIVLFAEPATALRLLFVAMIIGGIIGLKLHG